MTKSLLRLPFAFCLLTYYFSFSQSGVLKYAHVIIDTLASPSMHGRGYVMKGDSIAADYIKREFQKLGVKPLGRELYQRFSFPVNTFPDKLNLEIQYGDIELTQTPGENYLIESNSPESEGHASGELNIKGKYERIRLCDNKSIISNKYKKLGKNKYSNDIIVINECHASDMNKCSNAESWIINNSKARLIIIYKKDKLKWDVSQNQIKIPVFICNCEDSSHLGKSENFESVNFHINAKLISNYQSQNVIGYIQGTQYRDSIIVFTAHYDHLGMMGKDVYFPGANDNASGCAMLLNLAKYYSEHKPKYSIAFMAFGGEEVGLLGSKYYIEHQLFNINQIKFLINFDIVGTGDEGIKVVNATEHKKEFDELMKINEEKKYLPSVQPRGKASISDHYFFEEAGVKTFYIYTLGGIKAYHDIYDRPETLPLTKFEELYKLVIEFANGLQN